MSPRFSLSRFRGQSSSSTDSQGSQRRQTPTTPFILKVIKLAPHGTAIIDEMFAVIRVDMNNPDVLDFHRNVQVVAANLTIPEGDFLHNDETLIADRVKWELDGQPNAVTRLGTDGELVDALEMMKNKGFRDYFVAEFKRQ